MNTSVEEARWQLCKNLKRQRQLVGKDSFAYSVMDYQQPTTSEQRILLSRLADEKLIVLNTEGNKHIVTLIRPAFDDYLDSLEQAYGKARIWLRKDYRELYVFWEVSNYVERRLMYLFRPQQTPDLLFDYLVGVANGLLVTRKQLSEDGVVSSTSDFKRIFTEQVGFTPILLKTFVPILDKSRVMLKVQSEISYEDLAKLEKHLGSLTFPPDTRHKNVKRYRLPDF